MPLATGLPVSTAAVTTTAVAVVKTTAPNTTKDSNSGSNSFSVVTNTRYNFNSLLNSNVVSSILPVANTKTVLPTVETIAVIGNFNPQQQYGNTVVITNQQYNIGAFSPNNYIIPTSTSFVANTKTVLPTVEWLYTVGNNNQLQQYSNTTVITNNLYSLGAQTNPTILTNINFVANTKTTFNVSAIGGQVLRSVIVPTFSSDVLNFFIGTYYPTVNSLLKTTTINDFPSKPYTIKNSFTVVTNNNVVYGANTGSNSALGVTYVPAYSTTINDFPSKPYTIKNSFTVVTNNNVVYGANTGSNAVPGMTYIPAYSTTINDFPQKPYKAIGSASVVTYKFYTMPTIVYNSSSQYWLSGLKVDTAAYANSIYLIKSGFASSVTNYYGTGGGFDPNSPYLGASTAYWS
jgi:hypothetical protein